MTATGEGLSGFAWVWQAARAHHHVPPYVVRSRACRGGLVEPREAARTPSVAARRKRERDSEQSLWEWLTPFEPRGTLIMRT